MPFLTGIGVLRYLQHFITIKKLSLIPCIQIRGGNSFGTIVKLLYTKREKVFVPDFPEILSMHRKCMIRKDKCILEDTGNPVLVSPTSKA